MVRKPCPKSKKKTNLASSAPCSDNEVDLHSPSLLMSGISQSDLRPLSCRSTSLADLTLHEILKEQREKLAREKKVMAMLKAESEARNKKWTTTLASPITKASAKMVKRIVSSKEKRDPNQMSSTNYYNILSDADDMDVDADCSEGETEAEEPVPTNRPSTSQTTPRLPLTLRTLPMLLPLLTPKLCGQPPYTFLMLQISFPCYSASIMPLALVHMTPGLLLIGL
uniref:Uncharacterized protein n=1 Tax=Drosophila pseudoobscura pseudoobscura TaxID=46245 RepID=A0A0R3NX29_DROPS